MMMREGFCVTAEKIICKPVNVEEVTESMFPLTVVMSLVWKLRWSIDTIVENYSNNLQELLLIMQDLFVANCFSYIDP